MNSLVTHYSGGYPFDLDKVAFLQNNFSLLQKLAKAIGSSFPCIVEGCEVVGGTVTSGVVIISGEILPFSGGPLGTHVGVAETVQNESYEDGSNNPVSITRIAQFSLTGTVLFTDFIRIESLVESVGKANKSISNILQPLAIGDRTVLFGCKVNKIGNNYTHESGAIVYAGKVYTVDELSTSLTDSSVPKWKVDTTSVLENKIILCPSTDPGGLFTYDSVVPYQTENHLDTGFIGTIAPINCTVSHEYFNLSYVKIGKNMKLFFRFWGRVGTVVNPALNTWIQFKIIPPDYYRALTNTSVAAFTQVKFALNDPYHVFMRIGTNAAGEFIESLDNSFVASAGGNYEFHGIIDYIIK